MKWSELPEKLWIIQSVSNRDRKPKLGRGFEKACRFNPYNPLSYMAIILTVIIGVVMFGIIGFWIKMDFKNPFKWD